jgi:SPP1 family predicted phage head-tail adaptor
MTTSAAYIRTGAMRHRAELQAKTMAPDGSGGYTTTWTKSRDLWCQIRPLSGVQRLEAMRRQSSVTHEIYARYAADIAPTMRIVHGGVAYNIEAVWSPEERKEFVHCAASAGVAT